MIETVFGLIILAALVGSAYYFFVLKPNQDKKKKAAAIPPLPVLVWKEEKGVSGGQANGDRTHFRFSHPGAFYGENIEVQFDDILPIWVVLDGAVRTTPGTRVWKPESENDHKLVVVGDTGKIYKKCVIKYKG